MARSSGVPGEDRARGIAAITTLNPSSWNSFRSTSSGVSRVPSRGMGREWTVADPLIAFIGRSRRRFAGRDAIESWGTRRCILGDAESARDKILSSRDEQKFPGWEPVEPVDLSSGESLPTFEPIAWPNTIKKGCDTPIFFRNPSRSKSGREIHR
jgi:hypothetical protein